MDIQGEQTDGFNSHFIVLLYNMEENKKNNTRICIALNWKPCYLIAKPLIVTLTGLQSELFLILGFFCTLVSALPRQWVWFTVSIDN